MDCPRGQALIRTCLLLLICLQAGTGGQSLGPLLDRRASSGHAIHRRLLQAPSPGAATPGEVPPTEAPVAPPTLTPTDAPTPPPAISTTAPTPPPTKLATPPPTTPLPTTAAPVVTTVAPTPAPTTPLPTLPPLTPAPELTTLPPAVTPAAATLPPPTTFTPTATPILTTVAPLAPPTLTPSPTVAPAQPTVAPPGKTTPPPTLVPTLAPTTLSPTTLAPTTLVPTLSPTRSPTPPATSPPPGKTPAPLTVNASAPAPPLLSPVVTLASPAPAANTSGAAPGTSPPPATPTPLQTPLGTIAPTPSAVVNATPPGTLAPAPVSLSPNVSLVSPLPSNTTGEPPPGRSPPPATPLLLETSVPGPPEALNATTPPGTLAPAPVPLSPNVSLVAPLPSNTTGEPPPGRLPAPATPPLLETSAPGPSEALNATTLPACLPGTPSCDPLVVKLLLSNTTYGTLSQYLLTELAAQLGLQSNQFQFSAVNTGTSREFNVTFYILPVSGFNISETVAANVSDALSTHKVQLEEALFGNYTFFYAEPLSAMERGSAAPLQAPAPAPAPLPDAPAPAPSPENGTFPPVNDGGGGGSGSSTIIIVAAAVGGVAVLAVCALVMFCCLCRRNREEEPDDGFSEYSKTSLNPASTLLTRQHQNSFRTRSSAASMPSDSLPRPSSARVFTYEELADATNGWDPMYLLGEGGFGKVYKGVLKDGIKVAVKKLTVGGHQGDREFQVEVEMLSRLHHRHLVKLIGYYYRPDQQLLCYELVMNGSLENHLHGHGRSRRPPGAMWQTLQLDWDARMKIAIGAARGLAYLHEDCQPTVIHRDMKASNILLEDNFHAKVADFGLAKIAPDNRSDYLTTRVMGTFGYVAPEYAMTGHIMVKSDVYSYGVVLLELLTGRKPVDMSQPQGQENLVTWARPLMLDPEKVEDLVDPRLGDAYPFEDLLKVATIANACVHPDPARRPHMGEVVQKLRALQRTAGAESHVSDDSANGRDMEALASTLSGPLPAYTQSQPYPGGYMSTAYPPFPMHRSMEMPPHTTRSTMLSENTSRNSSESGRSQALMLDHDQLARTTVFSEGLEEGR